MNRRALLSTFVLGTLTMLPVSFAQMASAPASSAPKPAPGVLSREQAGPLMPQTVFFAGRVASAQSRNASGVVAASGAITVAALVDNSGYSSGVQERYQAYLLTESPLKVEGQTLPAGAYGVGFVKDKFLVMDIGDHTLFSVAASHDAELSRPVPLQFLKDAGSASGYKFYAGRNYVRVSLEPR